MTELVWDGKYRDGKRVAPVRIALPFQTVETVNESTRDRARTLDLFAGGKPTEWRNRLVWGDKKYVLPSLLPEFAGQVKLIYIDPPFDTGADFSFTRKIPDSDELLEKQPSMIEQKAYRDTWGRGLDSYMQWFYETVVLLKELLAQDGSVYVHVDENVGHYVKAVLDEVFGQESFQREIVWRIGWISGYKSAAKNWIRNHDTIFFYVKDRSRFTFNKEYIPYPVGYTRRDGSPPTGEGYPIEDVWNGTDLDRLDSIQIMSFSGEKVGYPTQKNENLVSRIIKASSNEGDLVLDCFVGSGTTPAVAEKLGRHWIGCDLGRFAIHTTRKRLLEVPGVKPFIVQNLGKYERQAWLAAEFEAPEDRAATEDTYRRFILDLYGAEPISCMASWGEERTVRPCRRSRCPGDAGGREVDCPRRLACRHHHGERQPTARLRRDSRLGIRFRAERDGEADCGGSQG
jgi:DNA modification methylase